MSDIPMKTCHRCGKSFPATEEYFYRNKQNKDGLTSWCRKCHSEYSSLRAREKRQKIKEKNISLPDANYLYLDKPEFKEDISFFVVVSQTQECWINVKARSHAEAVRKAYKQLEETGFYVDDCIFDENATLDRVEFDEAPEPEDYI